MSDHFRHCEERVKLCNLEFGLVKDLRISRFHATNPLVDHIFHPTLKAILKFQNHPSAVIVKEIKKVICKEGYSEQCYSNKDTISECRHIWRLNLSIP